MWRGEVMFGTLVGFYIGWGILWTIYSVVSTILHPMHPFDIDDWKTWLKMGFSTVAWPYCMVMALVNLDKQKKEWLKRHEQ